MNFLRKLSGQTSPAAESVPVHPYYPREIIIDGFRPNDKQAIELLLTFGIIWIPIFAVAWGAASVYNRTLKSLDKVILLWFTLCGCLHVFFEGYFVSNHDQIGTHQRLFAQLWKEYALSDSRYLISDTFVLSAEGLSVLVLGGLSWLMVYLISTSSPYRHPVQITICVGHLYSDLLYYATAMLDYYRRGIDYCRPEPYYFWTYYFGMNFIWIVVPAALLLQSTFISAKAFAALDRMAKTMQGNGRVTQPTVKPPGKS